MAVVLRRMTDLAKGYPDIYIGVFAYRIYVLSQGAFK